MNDSQIVDIYLMREEAAITYTSENMVPDYIPWRMEL